MRHMVDVCVYGWRRRVRCSSAHLQQNQQVDEGKERMSSEINRRKKHLESVRVVAIKKVGYILADDRMLAVQMKV